MFAASEPGAWYDPSDMGTMYQDAAGATPVYMPGQGQVDPPVGLLLDKRLGLTLGPELVSNGEFSDGTSGWSTSSSYQSSAAAVGGEMQVTSTAAFGRQVSPVSLTVGKTYVLTGKARAVGGVTARLHVGPSSTGGDAGAFVAVLTGSSLQTLGRIVFTATAAQMYVAAGSVSAGAVTYFDEISIKELPGNHAYQPTTTSRPTLSARYNLLTNTNWSGAVVGVPGTAPTGWSANFSTAAITGVSQLGNDYAIQLTASAQRLFFGQAFSAAANTTYSLSCLVVENAGVPIEQMLGFTGVPAGATLQWYMNGVASTNGVFPAAGARIELRLINGSATGTPAARVGIGCAVNATGTVGLAQPDVRVTGDGVGLPPYQRVVNANTYDTVGFPLYLKFDGVDDFLQTASVDFSGTDKALVAAAARKLSDAAIGCLVELSSWGGVSGALSIQAPRTASNNLSAALRDATNVAQYSIDGVESPSSFVLRAMFNISATGITNQIGVTANGATPSLSVSSAGPVVASALANAPIYIGRRAGTSQPFNGRLYGLLIRGAATPDATIATVERHLNSKARIY